MKFYLTFHLIIFSIAVSWSTGVVSAEADLSFGPYLQPTTAVVIRIDPSGLQPSESLQQISQQQGTASELIKSLTEDAAWLNGILQGQAMFVLIDIPFSQAQPPLRLMLPKVDESRQQELGTRLEALSLTKPVWDGQFAVVTLAEPKYADFDPFAIDVGTIPLRTDTFTTVLEQIKDYPIQVAVVPPTYLWRTFEELNDNLPQELGGGPIGRLTNGLQWAALGINPQQLDAMLRVQSTTADAAAAFAPFLPELAINLLSQAPVKRGVNLRLVTTALTPLVKTTVIDSQIDMRLNPATDANLAAESLIKMADVIITPLMGGDVSNKFRQMALAIHNYESTFRTLPPAQSSRGQDGKSGLSWRVHILPYLKEVELYKQFKLDEPWDSAHNKPLLDRMPPVFRTGTFRIASTDSDVPAGYTTIVAPVGEGTMFGGDQVVKFGMVADGLSNTILFVQVKPEFAVPWTAPDDYPFDPAKPAAGLDDHDGTGYRIVLGDGVVMMLPKTTSDEMLRKLFQMNDGQVVNFGQ